MTILSIRQPGYLPHMGFFKKIQSSDIFVMLDDVQYERGDWDNRNKIRTFDDSIWLTVPIFNKFGSKLNEVKIDYSKNWIKKHVISLTMNYQNTEYFNEFFPHIKSILEHKHEKLIDLNMDIINYILKILKIKTKIIRSSKLDIKSTGSQRLLEICQNLSADTYLSGKHGKMYLDEKLFLDNNITVLYEKFVHPKYNQCYKGFIPHMSILDALFNEGITTENIIKESKNI